MAKKNFAEKSGSALILVVVLTSLLSILAVMFMLSSRVDKITASAISGNKELDFAVDSVVATISQQLVDDVNFADHKYYDYPDANNPWLANLEPYQYAVNDFRWRHISDIYGRFVPLGDGLIAGIAKDYQDPINVGDSYPGGLYPADADGDGVSDSVWVELSDVSSSKGKPVYAAVRVIDNSAMLNVNTAYLFNAGEMTDSRKIDGSSQMQINLAALGGRDLTHPFAAQRARLFYERFNATGITPGAIVEPNPTDYWNYNNNVVWRLQPVGNYTPFDISDELKLRSRYILTGEKRKTRIEFIWTNAYYGGPETPIPTSSYNLDRWFKCADFNTVDPLASADYDYRHISTTYNMDRLVAPDGAIMVNANGVADADLLYGRLLRCIDPCALDWNKLNANMAQIAANIKDYGDGDADVTTVYDSLGNAHYGFEKPCIFISELVYKLVKVDITPAGLPEGTPPVYQTNWSYGIELSKLYPGINGDNWRLMIDDREIDINNLNPPDFAKDGRRYLVIIFEDPNASLVSTVKFSDSPQDGETGVDPNVILSWPALSGEPNATNFDVYFGTDPNAVLNATVSEPNGVYWGNLINNFFKPIGSTTDTTYYWRIDDTDSAGKVLLKGDVWSFTTWVSEPNVIFEYINKSDIFHGDSIISMQRQVNGHWLTVDSVQVPAGLVEEPNLAYTGVRSFQRDVSEARWIKRLWSNDVNGPATLGSRNNYFADPLVAGSMRARPGSFNNTGDLAMVFSKSTYYDTSAGQTPADAIGYTLGETEEAEEAVRIDLRAPNFQRIFQYLSAFGHADSQGRIKGRININTAPWYVIAQLPWVAQKRDNTTLMAFTDYKLAQAIAGYRDKTIIDTNLSYADTTAISNDGRYVGTGLSGLRETPGFESIGELATVINSGAIDPKYNIRYYALDGEDQVGFPDIDNSRRTLIDNATDDFEERYLIFSRMSDLVTVRSDVFTAYILVRVGNNGSQKRVIAILDRSDVAAGGKVKVIAVHPVPDPK
jgi:hypothetical protein